MRVAGPERRMRRVCASTPAYYEHTVRARVAPALPHLSVVPSSRRTGTKHSMLCPLALAGAKRRR